MTIANEIELGYPEQYREEIQKICSDSFEETDRDDLPEGMRQILTVTGYSLTAANFLDSATSGKTFSKTVMLLTGKATPGSYQDLNHAYVIFEGNDQKLRRPYFNKKQKNIRLWLHQKHLPTVLAQLNQPKVYCWIGHFGNGHIYGDIHTSNKI